MIQRLWREVRSGRRYAAAVLLVGALAFAGCTGELDPPAPGPSPSPSASPSPSGTASPAPSPLPPPAGESAWSNPATWGGTVPAQGADVTVDRPVLLDTDVSVASLTITPTGSLRFDPAASRSLESVGSVIVRGRLDARPAAADVVHTLRFTGANEGAYVGSVMEPVPTDVGLWVVEAGLLQVEGSAKTAWTTATGAIPAGATSITVADATGWQVGDEVTITPTAAGSTGASGYDTTTIAALSGNTLTLAAPTGSEHPAVEIPANAGQAARTATAEVLNLTRNVRIEGTQDGRAHVFINNSVPTVQTVRNTGLRHLGPRQPSGGSTESVTGRYGLHFHMSGANNAGSVVAGVVGREIGSHVFVAHLADGVSFVDNISHDTFDEPYWWDGAPDTRTPGPPTNDTLYEHNVASLAQSDPDFRGFRLAGFSLGAGDGNVARGNVAVGIQGNVTASGFIWPEGSEGLWAFEDNVAHNNRNHGIFTWQNTGRVHVISRFTAYHNGGTGIAHGAYGNTYRYENSTLLGNAGGAVELHAVSNGADPPLTFTGLTMDGAGLSDYLVRTDRHYAGAGVAPPTVISNSTLVGARRAAVGAIYAGGDGDTAPEMLDLIDNTYGGNEFWINDGVLPASRIRVRDAAHGSIELSPAAAQRAAGSTFNAAWNAAVRTIPAF